MGDRKKLSSGAAWRCRMGEGMRTQRRLDCYLCGSAGETIYKGLTDRFGITRGTWGFLRCTSPICGLVLLDPTPIEEDNEMAYDGYYPHTPARVAPIIAHSDARFDWSGIEPNQPADRGRASEEAPCPTGDPKAVRQPFVNRLTGGPTQVAIEAALSPHSFAHAAPPSCAA